MSEGEISSSQPLILRTTFCINERSGFCNLLQKYFSFVERFNGDYSTVNLPQISSSSNWLLSKSSSLPYPIL
uniref:Uncharacterized protein n=1 Tax=Lepeophtheirus salmonis TaxID=72036 RepID=A0A0K2U0C7_LEPSM